MQCACIHMHFPTHKKDIHVLMRDEKEGRSNKQQGKATHVYPQEILPWIILCMICECQRLDDIIDDIINDIISHLFQAFITNMYDEYRFIQCALILFVLAVC